MRPQALLCVVGILATGTALGQPLGLPLHVLRSLHEATASERAAVVEERAAQNTDDARPSPPAHAPRITPPARLPFDPEPVPQPPVAIPTQPTPSAPALNTTCSPYVRVTRASPVTGSFLLDAPCLGGRAMLGLFGNNPAHPFVIDEYGRAEFIFAAPEPELFPVSLIDSDTFTESLLHPFPDGPILIYDTAGPPPQPMVTTDPYWSPFP